MARSRRPLIVPRGGASRSHKLPPAVNACLFRHLLALDAFGFAPKLTRKVERLDSLLTAAAAGPGAGGYAVPAGLWVSIGFEVPAYP